jgi:hypothetical protein
MNFRVVTMKLYKDSSAAKVKGSILEIENTMMSCHHIKAQKQIVIKILENCCCYNKKLTFDF